MATPPAERERAPKKRQPTAAEILAALGAKDAAAPAFDGTKAGGDTAGAMALTSAEVAAGAAKIVGALVEFGARRANDDFLWIVATLRRRYPEKPAGEVEALARRELAYDVEFRRKQRLRLERDLPEALRTEDPAARAAAVTKILEREKRWLGQRREAMAERAIAAAELDSVRRASPLGAYWHLSPHVREHTLDCLALGEKFWPWEVLDEVHPPLHHGCACSLYTLAEAVERGWMHEDQVPDADEATARAAELLGMASDAMREGVSPREVEAYRLARELDLAEADALEERAHSAEYEAETKEIRARKDTPEAKQRHRFRPAKWTHPNGHPRCSLCGAEERTGGICNGEPTRAEAEAWAKNENENGMWGDSTWEVTKAGKLTMNLAEGGEVELEEVRRGYYGEKAWQRFHTGFHEGGEFKGRRTGIRTHALRKAGRSFGKIAGLLDLETPAQKRRAGTSRPSWLNGQLVNVPEHRDFARTIDGETFTSPPGTSDVFRAGKRLDATHPLRRPGGPKGKRSLLVGPTVRPGDLKPGDHIEDLAGERFRVEDTKPARFAKGKVKLKLAKPKQGNIPEHPAGTFSFGAEEDTGFRLVPAPASPALGTSPPVGVEQRRIEDLAEELRHELGLPALSHVASALDQGKLTVPPVADGMEGAASDRALRQAGFREQAAEFVPSGIRFRYAHPDAGATLSVTYTDAGTATDVMWEPRGLKTLTPRRLDSPPKTFEEFAGHLASLVSDIGIEEGVDTFLRDVTIDPSLSTEGSADHGGSHEWNGDVLLDRLVGPSIENAGAKAAAGIPLTANEKRETWTAYKVAHHEAMHALNPITQEDWADDAARNIEEWATEEGAYGATVEALHQHQLGEVADWAAASPLDERVQGVYLPQRAAADRILDDAGVAPEQRQALIREIKLHVDPGSRAEALAELLQQAQGGHRADHLERVRRDMGAPGKVAPGFVHPQGIPTEATANAPTYDGTILGPDVPVRLKDGTEAKILHVRGERADWTATVRTADGRTLPATIDADLASAGPAPSDRRPRTLAASSSGHVEVSAGDHVQWDGRADGGLSGGRVTRIVRDGNDWAVEVTAGTDSLAPGATVILTDRRTRGTIGPAGAVNGYPAPRGDAERAVRGRTRAAGAARADLQGIRPTNDQARDVAAELGIALPSPASPGDGEADLLPNGRSRARAEAALALYDQRMAGGYKNQQIAARQQVKSRSGMNVRELRKWLAENPAAPGSGAPASPEVAGVGAGPDFAALIHSELERRRSLMPKTFSRVEHEAGWDEGMLRAREIALRGGSFDDVADEFRAFRAENIPRDADSGDHPWAEGVVTGMIFAATAGRDAEAQRRLEAYARPEPAYAPSGAGATLAAEFPGVEVEVNEMGDGLYLHRVEVPEERRGQGLFRALLGRLGEIADERGVVATTYPVAEDGTAESLARLRRGYERAGFVDAEGPLGAGYMVRRPAAKLPPPMPEVLFGGAKRSAETFSSPVEPLWVRYGKLGAEDNRVRKDVNAPEMDRILKRIAEVAEDEQPAGALQVSELRGETHAHTTWSDGHMSVAELGRAAEKRGLGYVVVSDHADKVPEGGWEKQQAEIDGWNEAHPSGPRLIKGIEANIGPEGELDLPEGVEFEWVNAGLHSDIHERATERLLAALEDPRVSALAHPHKSRGVDWEALAPAAARAGVPLEVNGRDALRSGTTSDAREMVSAALRHGAQLQIGSDAHRGPNLADRDYAARVAAQAGAAYSDVHRGPTGKPSPEFAPAAFREFYDGARQIQVAYDSEGVPVGWGVDRDGLIEFRPAGAQRAHDELTRAVARGDAAVTNEQGFGPGRKLSPAFLGASDEPDSAPTQPESSWRHLWPDHGVAGTPSAELDPRIASLADVTVEKGMDPGREAYSAFDGLVAPGGKPREVGDTSGKPLAEVLRARGIKRNAVGGLATDYCVQATALSSVAEGFETWFLSDASRGIDAAGVEAAVERMRAAGVHIGSPEPNAETSLIAVDVQGAFIPGYPGAGELSVPDGEAVVGELQREEARGYGLVVASRDFHPPNHLSFASQGPAGGKPSPAFEAEPVPPAAAAADPKVVAKVAALEPGTQTKAGGFTVSRSAYGAQKIRVTSPGGLSVGDFDGPEEAAGALAEALGRLPKLKRDKSREGDGPGATREHYDVVAPDGTVIAEVAMKIKPVASGGKKYATSYAKVWWAKVPDQKSIPLASKASAQQWAEGLAPKPGPTGKASPAFEGPAPEIGAGITGGLDYYKATMAQVQHANHPTAQVTFEFRNRNAGKPGGRLLDHVTKDELQARLDRFRPGFSDAELAHLGSLERPGGDGKVFSGEFLDYLRGRELPPVKVTVRDGDLAVETSGDWPMASMWETVVLAELNGAYFEDYARAKGLDEGELRAEGDRRLTAKIEALRAHPEIKLAEFGTRRRFSGEWQRHVVDRLRKEVPGNLVGTSNVRLAHEFGLTPIGSYAHEMDMVYAALADAAGEDVPGSHQRMMDDWARMYGDEQAIALTDTFGSGFFFRSLTTEQARRWRGLRHDSGDPFEFGERALDWYEKHGIDPAGKTLLFSDSLDVPTMVALQERFGGRVGVVFGVGTNLTNDLGVPPLNVVMKATRANGKTTVKLSDDPGKATGTKAQVERYGRLFGGVPEAEATPGVGSAPDDVPPEEAVLAGKPSPPVGQGQLFPASLTRSASLLPGSRDPVRARLEAAGLRPAAKVAAGKGSPAHGPAAPPDETMITVRSWAGDEVEAPGIAAAVRAARQLWDEAGASPGKPSVQFLAHGQLLQIVHDRKLLGPQEHGGMFAAGAGKASPALASAPQRLYSVPGGAGGRDKLIRAGSEAEARDVARLGRKVVDLRAMVRGPGKASPAFEKPRKAARDVKPGDVLDTSAGPRRVEKIDRDPFNRDAVFLHVEGVGARVGPFRSSQRLNLAPAEDVPPAEAQQTRGKPSPAWLSHAKDAAFPNPKKVPLGGAPAVEPGMRLQRGKSIVRVSRIEGGTVYLKGEKNAPKSLEGKIELGKLTDDIAAGKVVPLGAKGEKPTPTPKDGWKSKVYGSRGGESPGYAPEAKEPRLKVDRIAGGEIVRDPQGETWKIALTGTHEEPTVTLTSLSGASKELPEADLEKGKWTFVRGPAGGSKLPGQGWSSLSKPPEPKPPEQDDSGALKRTKSVGAGAELFQDSAGRGWIVQRKVRADQRAQARLGNAVYRELGIEVPNVGTVKFDGKDALATPLPQGGSVEGPEDGAARLGAGFMADALLANHEAYGEHAVVWVEGRPVRFGQEGTLGFKRDGGQKNAGAVPQEVWTMLQPGRPGFEAVEVSEDERRAQAGAIAAKLTPERVGELVEAAGFKSDKEAAYARDALSARAAWMGRYARGEENEPKPLEGEEARAELAPTKPLPDDVVGALQTFGGGWGAKANAEYRAELEFPRDEALLASLGGPEFAPVDGPDWSGDVDVGQALGGMSAEDSAKSTKSRSAGVIVAEPDGRVWMMEPRGGFGGYSMILPKGRVDKGESEQEAALRELFEETGLQAEVTGLVGDYEGDVTITRYFLARRTGGTPTLSNESQRVVLGTPTAAGLKGRDTGAIADAGVGSHADREVAGRLDEALDRSRAAEDFVGWASVPEGTKLEKGAAFEERGYLALALDGKVVERKGTVPVRVTVFKGQRALLARHGELADAEGLPDVLAPRGTRLRVVGVGKDGVAEAVLT